VTHSATHKKAMIKALEKSLGIVTIACKEVGVDRRTHYRWLQKDPQYKEDVDAIADIALDFAESQLHQQIKDKDTSATIFYLKCKGKKRGYIEKTEHGFTDKEGNDIPVIFNPAPYCEPIKDNG